MLHDEQKRQVLWPLAKYKRLNNIQKHYREGSILRSENMRGGPESNRPTHYMQLKFAATRKPSSII
jgi:hypothetical protein